MKLTYWIAECFDDSDAYNIRAKTRKEATAMLAKYHNPESYGPVKKVSVEYLDGFDLVTMALGEGRGHWEC